MKHYLQLFDKNGNMLLGSDGVMYYDRRKRIAPQVLQRNARFARNFPHKIAGFYSEERHDDPARYNPDKKYRKIPV